MARRSYGTVRKLPSGRWQARYRDAAGNRRSALKTFSTKTEAHRFLAGTETDLAAASGRTRRSDACHSRSGPTGGWPRSSRPSAPRPRSSTRHSSGATSSRRWATPMLVDLTALRDPGMACRPPPRAPEPEQRRQGVPATQADPRRRRRRRADPGESLPTARRRHRTIRGDAHRNTCGSPGHRRRCRRSVESAHPDRRLLGASLGRAHRPQATRHRPGRGHDHRHRTAERGQGQDRTRRPTEDRRRQAHRHASRRGGQRLGRPPRQVHRTRLVVARLHRTNWRTIAPEQLPTACLVSSGRGGRPRGSAVPRPAAHRRHARCRHRRSPTRSSWRGSATPRLPPHSATNTSSPARTPTSPPTSTASPARPSTDRRRHDPSLP